MTRSRPLATLAVAATLAAGIAAVTGMAIAASPRDTLLAGYVAEAGSTASAAAKALKRAGVSQVDVLSFARVVFDTDMTV